MNKLHSMLTESRRIFSDALEREFPTGLIVQGDRKYKIVGNSPIVSYRDLHSIEGYVMLRPIDTLGRENGHEDSFPVKTF